MSKLGLLVEAGAHNREAAPVTVELEAGQLRGQGEGLVCVDVVDATGQPSACVPGQLEKVGGKRRLTFVVDHLRSGASRRYVVTTGRDASRCCPEGGGVELKDCGDSVDIVIGGELFTRYQYSERFARPFLYPVLGPSGKPITRTIAEESAERMDHPHHRSLYVAWGDVNGANCWDEMENHGFVRHVGITKLQSGPVYGDLHTTNTWTDKDGKKLLEQTSKIRFYGTPKSARLIDHSVLFKATEGDVRFGDTKEGGIMSLRVLPSMNVTQLGRMVNGYGAVNEAECWGRRAPWCDYSGPAHGEWVGITIMNHPGSFAYPTYWHARDYGLMTANPFGLSAFLGEGYDGSHVLPAGEELKFIYRLLIHAGDAEAAGCAARFHDWINPPKASVVT